MSFYDSMEWKAYKELLAKKSGVNSIEMAKAEFEEYLERKKERGELCSI